MTRWARPGSTQRHRKLPEDPTPWEEFVLQRTGSESDSRERKATNLNNNPVKKGKKRKQKQHNKLQTECGNAAVKSVETNTKEQKDSCTKKQKSKQLKRTESTVCKQVSINESTSDTELSAVVSESSTKNNQKSVGVILDTADEPNSNVDSVPTEKMGETRNEKRKKKFLDRVKEKRLQNGILLLPKKIETKLYKMKKGLREKGMPGEKIREIIRQARRKEELKFRKTLKTCYNCRQSGHVLSACPLIAADAEQGTGICFKCGSTEHTSYKCHSKISGFPFAKCFICHEQGHLSKDCPKNKHGAYPKGGKCNFCGDINHLKKDCPKLKKKETEEELTAAVMDGLTSIEEEVIDCKESIKVVPKTTKVVKF